MAHGLRLHYGRYQMLPARPEGASAFFDFAAAAIAPQGPRPKSSLLFHRRKAAQVARAEEDEDLDEERAAP